MVVRNSASPSASFAHGPSSHPPKTGMLCNNAQSRQPIIGPSPKSRDVKESRTILQPQANVRPMRLSLARVPHVAKAYGSGRVGLGRPTVRAVPEASVEEHARAGAVVPRWDPCLTPSGGAKVPRRRMTAGHPANLERRNEEEVLGRALSVAEWLPALTWLISGVVMAKESARNLRKQFQRQHRSLNNGLPSSLQPGVPIFGRIIDGPRLLGVRCAPQRRAPDEFKSMSCSHPHPPGAPGQDHPSQTPRHTHVLGAVEGAHRAEAGDVPGRVALP